ncbi:MAG: FAD-dependent oxidoreductase, partial [Ilumatobacteraceae bacterium]
GMPTKLLGLSRSRLLTWSGKLRAATEPLRRRTSLDTDSIGAFVRARFGNEVHFRLVDPLIGSIYAADTDYFSLAAVPQVADLAHRSRSVLLAARHRGAPPIGPVFYAPSNGMTAMVDAGSAAIRSAGGSILTARPVGSIAPDGAGWRVDSDHADAVIMCCPAAVTARLIAPFAPEPAVALAAIPTADVALLTITVAASEWPERLLGRSGYLVPKPRQRLVTAVSFGSQKWAHWQVDGKVVLRISLGRDGLPVLHLDDDQLLAAAVADTSRQLGFQVRPIDVRISRFPGAFPQYRPHHADRVTAAEAMLPTGLELAGASFHGIGIPACVRSATGAAARVSEYFDRLAHLA